MRKVELLPTWDCEAGYGPALYVTLVSKLLRQIARIILILDAIVCLLHWLNF